MSDTLLFDKLVYIDRLKRGGIDDNQARAHAEAMTDALRESVATKADLRTESNRLATKIEAETTRLENKIEVEASRLENKIEAESTRLRHKIEADFTRLELSCVQFNIPKVFCHETPPRRGLKASCEALCICPAFAGRAFRPSVPLTIHLAMWMHRKPL